MALNEKLYFSEIAISQLINRNYERHKTTPKQKSEDLLKDELLRSCRTTNPLKVTINFRGKEIECLYSVAAVTAIRGDRRWGFFSISFMSVCLALCNSISEANAMFKFFKVYWVGYDLKFSKTSLPEFKTLASEYERQKGNLKFSIKPDLQEIRSAFVSEVSEFQISAFDHFKVALAKTAQELNLF